MGEWDHLGVALIIIAIIGIVSFWIINGLPTLGDPFE